jgi:hypothetical protein
MKEMTRLEELQQKKSLILENIQNLGDFRRGSLVKRFIACQKGMCHCTDPESKGHGPKYSLTYKLKGKTKTEYIAAEEARQVSEQVWGHKKFLQLCQEFVEVNEEICRLRVGRKKKLRNRG